MSRTDPYQVRARELCLASGIEPDSRIGEGRGQPAWCTFRDATAPSISKFSLRSFSVSRANSAVRSFALAVSLTALAVCNSKADVRHSVCLSLTSDDQYCINKNATVAIAASAVAVPQISSPYQERSNQALALSSRAGSTGRDSKTFSLIFALSIIGAAMILLVMFVVTFMCRMRRR